MEFQKKTAVVDAIIDEYLKPSPNEKDVQQLMEKLEIEYSDNGLANMQAVLESMSFQEPAPKKRK